MSLGPVDEIVNSLKVANAIVLSTHRQPDGDGLGAQIAMYHALKKLGKKVRILNVDETPRRYHFLLTPELIEYFEGSHRILDHSDLALIFDTNDKRLLGPLYEELEKKCDRIVFVDHHPILKQGPKPTIDSAIDTSAASTGEIAFNIIRKLNVDMDARIARSLYSSIVFDTQLFRYVRNSSQSHFIAIELLKWEKNPEQVHRYLFGHHTVEKIRFLAKTLDKIEYYGENQVAFLSIDRTDLEINRLDMDDSRDLIDLVMNISSLEVAILIREDKANHFKISIRSKGNYPVLALAEKFGGGGHAYSSGAYVSGELPHIKDELLTGALNLIGSVTPKKGLIG